MACKRPAPPKPTIRDVYARYMAAHKQQLRLEKDRRSRRWFLTVNYAYMREAFRRFGFDDFTEDEFRAFIVDACDRYAETHASYKMIALKFHDMDPAEDDKGRPILNADMTYDEVKTLHAHIVIDDSEPVRWSTLIQHFNMSERAQNATPIRGIDQLTYWMLYLTHSNERDRLAGKYEYDLRDVELWFPDIPHDGDPRHKQMAEARYRAMRAHKVASAKAERDEDRAAFEREHQRAVEFGRETPEMVKGMLDHDDKLRKRLGITGDNTYSSRVYGLMQQSQQDRLHDLKAYYCDDGNNRRLLTVYIKAPGGSSKTEVAGLLGRHVNEVNGCPLGIQQISTAGRRGQTFDPAGTWSGELVCTVNEAELRYFGLNGFKDMLDPTHVPMVGSRYADKFWSVQAAFLTASDDIEQQMRELVEADAASSGLHRSKLGAGGLRETVAQADWDAELLRRYGDQLHQIARRIGLVIEFVPLSKVRAYVGTYQSRGVTCVNERRSAPAALDVPDGDGDAFVVIISGFDNVAEHHVQKLDFHGDVRACDPTSWVRTTAGDVLYPVSRASFMADDMGFGQLAADDPSLRNTRTDLTLATLSTGGSPMCCGRWRTLALLPYRIGDEWSQRTLVKAYDVAADEYYRYNGYSVNPSNTPFMPDLETYVRERAVSAREAADAAREAVAKAADAD